MYDNMTELDQALRGFRRNRRFPVAFLVTRYHFALLCHEVGTSIYPTRDSMMLNEPQLLGVQVYVIEGLEQSVTLLSDGSVVPLQAVPLDQRSSKEINDLPSALDLLNGTGGVS